jgi:hypothetical protein
MAGFQPVDGSYAGGSKSDPELCVWTSGKWHLTPAADRQYFDGAETVGIHQDPGQEGVVIGLEPAPDDPDATNVRSLSRSEGDGADINAIAIQRRLGIDPKEITECQRFDLEEHSGEGPVVATVNIGPLANGAAKVDVGNSTVNDQGTPDEDIQSAVPGAEEADAAEAVEDLDAGEDSPPEPEDDSATEVFEDAVEEEPEEWSEIETPDWLYESSFYASLKEASDLEELREVLGWKNKYDGKLDRFVERLGVWSELDGGDHGGE